MLVLTVKLVALTLSVTWGLTKTILFGVGLPVILAVLFIAGLTAFAVPLLILALLGVFKYTGFVVDTLKAVFPFMRSYATPIIPLPIGISFYTFQALSYSIDVYRQKIEPTKDIIAFFAFISFFPQLVAGPIERAGLTDVPV